MRSPRDDELSEATLSLVDEFLLDEARDGALFTLWDTDMAATMQIHSPDEVQSSKNESKRRSEYNARRKLLRKTGVYSDPNRARNARKKEVADLREQVEKLQIDLEVWQGHKSQERAEPCRTSASSLALLPNKWQEIALNQRRRRKESERDNARLKFAVAHQQDLAKHLFGLLRKRSTQLRNECSSLMNLTSSQHYVVDVLDYNEGVADFQLLLRELDAAYREIDTVFAVNGLASSTISPIDVHVRDGVDGKHIELCSYKVLPFDVGSTTDAAWAHFKGMEKHLGNGSVYRKAEKDLDEPYTIVADFTKELYADSSRADIQVKQVVRRYVEDDRDIVIWVSRARPAEIKHKMLRGLTYRLRGYAVTKRFSGSTPGRELSEFQQCSLLALDQDVKTKYRPGDVDTITDFLLVNAAQNIRVHRELIENALVDKARTQLH
ncbi:Dynein heavy chain 1 [Phytophthora cinnamomi]|uniref:Dynein heavy chain 1 n=1 Tax=Phytophthora cinnamomi TaxID=4785 RepID=UPI00355AB535|nr:Dynein heavy chain 1 [Phytophthora cinnamomi]